MTAHIESCVTITGDHYEALRAALKPMAEAADNFDGHPIKNPDEWYAYSGTRTGGETTGGAITVGDLRRARDAYRRIA